jgi:hypothetical protein
MKALKSKLASELLADPTASSQLRRFLMNQRPDTRADGELVADQFELRRASGVVRVKATFVPKAKAA